MSASLEVATKSIVAVSTAWRAGLSTVPSTATAVQNTAPYGCWPYRNRAVLPNPRVMTVRWRLQMALYGSTVRKICHTYRYTTLADDHINLYLTCANHLKCLRSRIPKERVEMDDMVDWAVMSVEISLAQLARWLSLVNFLVQMCVKRNIALANIDKALVRDSRI